MSNLCIRNDYYSYKPRVKAARLEVDFASALRISKAAYSRIFSFSIFVGTDISVKNISAITKIRAKIKKKQ